jgi:hypothetical protein
VNQPAVWAALGRVQRAQDLAEAERLARALSGQSPHLSIPLAVVARRIAATNPYRAEQVAAEAETAARRAGGTALIHTPVALFPLSSGHRALQASAHRMLSLALSGSSWYHALPALGTVSRQGIAAADERFIIWWSHRDVRGAI